MGRVTIEPEVGRAKKDPPTPPTPWGRAMKKSRSTLAMVAQNARVTPERFSPRAMTRHKINFEKSAARTLAQRRACVRVVTLLIILGLIYVLWLLACLPR